ncbi:MAG: hypothetical protein NPIRA04_05490 [Nitrospirales bacterium]|nr:MAG: hypothetical protein NPIRA04_05490 [Nitrospirales bacterium]
MLSIFLRNHDFPSLVLLTSVTISACSITLPQSVLRVEHDEKVVAERASAPSYLHLVPHHDRLGWTVYPRQPLRQEIARTTTERWNAFTQTHDSVNPLASAIAIPLCPVTLVLGYATAGLKPSDQAFELPFKTCPAIIGYRWSLTEVDYPVIHPNPLHIEHTEQPIPSGTLTMIVSLPDGTTRSIQRQVTPATSETGIPMRLRWVTHTALESAPSDDIWTTLSASLVLASKEQILVHEPLSVSPQQWQQAYATPILEADAAAWPTSLRIRWSLVPLDVEFPSDTFQFTQVAFEEGLASHDLVVITQESRMASTNQLLAQHVVGRFDETRLAKPGRWRGANVLLLGEIHTLVSGTHELVLTLINIETGIVLSKLSYEAPLDAWKDLIHAARGDVLDVLHAHDR